MVTGASTPLGRAIATAVLGRGERLVATTPRRDAIAPLERSAPERAVCVELDVTDPIAVTAVVDGAVARFGRVDVLVTNADPGLEVAPDAVASDMGARRFDVTVMGALHTARAVLPHMRSRRHGHIVQLSPVASVRAHPGHELYAGAKFALDGVSAALADDVSGSGIHVLIAEPSPFHVDPAGRYTQWVAAILTAVDSDDPPLRLRLGPEAVAGTNS